MTASYQISPAADRDLDDPAAYLAQEVGLEKALRFLEAAAATFEQVARMPGVGQRWETAQPRLTGLRVCRIEGFTNHLIFYRAVDVGIEIVRVLHGARDIARILDSQD